MNEHTDFLVNLVEEVDCYLSQHSWLKWLGRQMMPNIGTLLMVVVLLLTIPSLAAPLIVPSATSTSVISYQGRLADSNGNPLTGEYDLEFRIYEEQVGGEPLWRESQPVSVSDGLFSVMLGNIDDTLAEATEGHDELYLGIKVDDDSEMEPRVQLGSVPFSMQAMTVPDGSITTEKIATEALTTTHLLDGAVTRSKLASGLDLVPAGTIVMWSGSIAAIPDNWALCDGANGTPDLRDRFILSVSASEDPGEMGGSHTKTLVVSNMPPHTHTFLTDSAGSHSHGMRTQDETGFQKNGYSGGGMDDTIGRGLETTTDGTHTHSGTTNATGSGSSFDIRPKYYKLAFIMKR